jgi:predicted MPP superfamily phosphohydrolase
MVQIPAFDTLTIVWEMDAYLGAGSVEMIGPAGPLSEKAVHRGKTRYEATFRTLPAGAQLRYLVVGHSLLGRETVLTPEIVTQSVPPRGRPFRFIAFGDSGNGSNTQAELALKMSEQKPDLLVHVGDLVYPAGAAKDYGYKFFEPNAPLLRSAPFMASLGNHDCATDKGQPMLDAFVLPENGPGSVPVERNYWFDYGDARFIALDTNTNEAHGLNTKEEMKQVFGPWLREALAGCDAKWKFLFFHHPPYTCTTVHQPETHQFVKDAYLAIIDSAGVDAVFCGHNHLYERIGPMKADQIVPDGQGTLYITTGAGGVSRYEAKLVEKDGRRVPERDYVRAWNDSVFSFTRVDISADRLELVQIDEAGRVIDQYTIRKGGGMAAIDPIH